MDKLENWVLKHATPRDNKDDKDDKDDIDWKLTILVKDVMFQKIRVFLRHQNFQEYPMKTTCHGVDKTKYYTTILPYHPHQQMHIHAEHVVQEHSFSTSKETVTLQGVQIHEDTNDLVCIQSTLVEHGSIFKRNDLDLVLTLVEKTFMQEHGQVIQNKTPKSNHFYFLLTWNSKTPNTTLRRRLASVLHLLNWFDF